MKREIKFRVWDNVDWMSSPFTFSDIKSGKIGFVNDLPVMQFTGLKDKNGKEIYEGDILRAPANMSYRFKDEGKVQFIEDYGGFAVVAEWSKNQHHELLTCDVAIDCEVIGNIYENPELINPL